MKEETLPLLALILQKHKNSKKLPGNVIPTNWIT